LARRTDERPELPSRPIRRGDRFNLAEGLLLSAETRTLRARKAGLARQHGRGYDFSKVDEERLLARAREIAAGLPPISTETADKIAAIFHNAVRREVAQ
jgi:hypothetical protein